MQNVSAIAEGRATGSLNGRSVHTGYTVFGDGPPVVLIHGFGMNRTMWRWLVPDLADRFQVITYDLLGHGESSPPSDDVDLSELSHQIETLAEHLDLGEFAIAGFSLGGLIARRYAIDHPGRLNSLAILHSSHDRSAEERDAMLIRVRQATEGGPASTVDAAIERWFNEPFRREHPETTGLVRDWILSNDADVYARIYRVLATGDAELADGIRQISCPTLLMTGDIDVGNTVEMSRQMAELIPDSTLTILPGLKHMALAEDPATFNAPVVRHLADTLLK